MNKIELVKALLLDDELKPSESKGTFLKVGMKVLIRTVTMIYTGEIKALCGDEILLRHAAWIADTGRWADNLKSCEFNEVEPYYKDVIVFRGGILDVTEIDQLPLEQK